jgi:hypothetical protein
MIQNVYRRALTFLALGVTALAAGCAPPQPAPTPVASAAVPPGMVTYGNNMKQEIQSDQILAQILRSNDISKEFGVGLVVDPNGYVEKGFMVKSEMPVPAAEAVINHLINVNFGDFTPDMPNHKLIIVLPVYPPAAS